MKKDELIKLCKYYKGEDNNPFKDDKQTAWSIENNWVKEVSGDKPSALLAEYCLTFQRIYPQWANDKVIPMSLKALLHDRYTHFGGSDDGFIKWIKKYYRLK